MLTHANRWKTLVFKLLMELKMTTKYEPEVIQEFADRLYAQAKSIIATYTFMGALLLGFAGLAIADPILGLIGALAGGATGYNLGKEKAFLLKLKAQTALCQVQTEINSRKTSD